MKTTRSCGCLGVDAQRARIVDLTGQRFGRLTAIRPTDKRSIRTVKWECRCDCGKTIIVRLNGNHTRSCGCLLKESQAVAGRKNAKDLTGERYGRLVAVKATNRRSGQCVEWECRCDCGSMVIVALSSLRGGRTRSCGCLNVSNKITLNLVLSPNDIPYPLAHEYMAVAKNRRLLKEAAKRKNVV